MNSPRRYRGLLAVLALAAAPLRANVSLASIFTDATVVQRGQPIAVWGTAGEGEEVGNPIISIENKAGLPLRPFRTDRSELISGAKLH